MFRCGFPTEPGPGGLWRKYNQPHRYCCAKHHFWLWNQRPFVYDVASSFRACRIEKKAKALNNHLILLGVPNMKISLIGPLTLGALALAAGSAFADAGPNLQDSQGAAVKDASGACVVTSGQMLPECRPNTVPTPSPA